MEQNKSQDDVVGIVEQLPLPTPLEALVSALETCQSVSQFAALTDGYSLELVEDAIALSDTQPRRTQLRQWYAAAIAVEPQPVQVKVGDRLRLAKNLFATSKGKVVQILESFGDLFETNWGAVSLAEIESGTWELIPSGVACES